MRLRFHANGYYKLTMIVNIIIIIIIIIVISNMASIRSQTSRSKTAQKSHQGA